MVHSDKVYPSDPSTLPLPFDLLMLCTVRLVEEEGVQLSQSRSRRWRRRKKEAESCVSPDYNQSRSAREKQKQFHIFSLRVSWEDGENYIQTGPCAHRGGYVLGQHWGVCSEELEEPDLLRADRTVYEPCWGPVSAKPEHHGPGEEMFLFEEHLDSQKFHSSLCLSVSYQ